eukprot:SAG11_NODE_34693_length_270_cov_1.204678_1_plen_41_part_10
MRASLTISADIETVMASPESYETFAGQFTHSVASASGIDVD